MRKAVNFLILLTIGFLILKFFIPQIIKVGDGFKPKKEAVCTPQGALKVVRSALEAYRNDHSGQSPSTLDELVQNQYLKEIPMLWLNAKCEPESYYPHPPTNRIEYVSNKYAEDLGTWAYLNNPSSPYFGDVYIYCVHIEKLGKPFSHY